MSEIHHNSYKIQKDDDQKDFRHYSDGRFLISNIDTENRGHIIPSGPTLESPTLVFPPGYAVGNLQVLYPSSDPSPPNNWKPVGGTIGQIVGFSPDHPISHAMNPLVGSPLLHHLDRSPMTRILNVPNIDINPNRTPPLNTEASRCISSKPVTNRLDILPQQISKGSMATGDRVSLISIPTFPLSKQNQTIGNVPEPPTFPPLSLCSTKDQYSSRDKLAPFKSHTTSSLKRLLDDPDIKESFFKLGPLLGDINTRNYSSVLVELLRPLHQHIDLDELYSLFFKGNPSIEFIESRDHASQTLPPDSRRLKLKALNILSLVLVTFQCPNVTVGYLGNVSGKSLSVPPATFQNILRNFLAVKIIFASVEKVNHFTWHHFSVSRASIYKVYYIICRKLIQKYPNISQSHGFEKSLILSHVMIAKITNLIYPNTIKKRLGKRGQSKEHYIGLALNKTTVDQEISDLLELDMTQLYEHFTRKRGGKDELEKNIMTDTHLQTCEKQGTPLNTSSDCQVYRGSQLDSSYAKRNFKFSTRFRSRKTKTVQEPSMGPSLIWKDSWKP
ncbi:hypothetical protein JCM33374_g1291 [Metschnikowia sp. JCM 33374]|nr:hypothetical protein JCM33374_g1291 [Metschnikowia sp. JCM 33374]